MADRPDWDNTKKWEVPGDFNVFAEHSRTVREKDGKSRKIKFTRRDLEEIAKNCNARDARGQPCPLTLGHTDDRASEESQPDIVGYARKFHVAFDDDLKRDVVRATFYLRREDVPRAQKFPRVSVEVWDEAKFFDPIALLKRTPQLDLGQWTYGRGDHAGDRKLRYSMDDLYDDDEGKGKDRVPPPGAGRDDDDDGDLPPPDDRGGDAPLGREHGDGPQGVPPDVHEHFKRCMRHHGYPLKDAMGDGGAVDDVAAPGDMPPPRQPATPPPDRDGPQRNRRRRTPEDLRLERLEKLIYGMQREIRGVAKERDDFAIKSERAECRELLQETLPGRVYDPETEVDILLPLDQDRRRERLRYLKATLQADPTHGGPVRLADDQPVMRNRREPDGRTRVTVSGGAEGGPGREDDEFDEAMLERAAPYIRQHPGCSHEEAVEYARGRRTLDGRVVDQVRNGRR